MNIDPGEGAATAYRFRDCEVDLELREIRRADRVVAVEPKVFDLLVYLIKQRDRAVSKDELQDEIWRGVIVTEAALTRCVMKARRAISDDVKGQEAIKTVRGHGYRFSTSVEVERRGGKAAALTLPDKPSVVVLPFTNLSDDLEQEYFSDGITEDIITELSRFRSLFVIARHSSFSFKGKNLKTSEIASELGVAFVVDGSIQRSGNRVRINVRLVEAENDSQLWSERYDRELEDILLVQEEVASTVSATIGGRVEATRGRNRMDKAGIQSYDLLLKSQALYYVVSREANEEAQRLLELAIALDPDNARALALLAAVYSASSWSFWADDNALAQRLSLETGQRSINIDDTDSLAQALYAEILIDCGQYQKAETHFVRAIELNPNDIAARTIYASKLSARGRVNDAVKHMKIVERLDPFGRSFIPWIKGIVMFAARRYEECVLAMISMSQPPNEARYLLAASLGRLGRTEEAQEYVTAFLEQAKKDMPHYPGDDLASWEPVFDRMTDYKDPADLVHLIDSLRLAGWQ